MSLAEKLLSYQESHRPIFNDLTVYHSSVDYDRESNSLRYILMDLLIDATGKQPRHLFKAIKLVRLVRVPNNDRIANFLMEKQSEVLASMWENEVHFISLVANILKPDAVGLIYTYGVQGIGGTLEEAKRDADRSFSSLITSLKGVFRTIEFRKYNYTEAEWLRKKMITMKNLAVLRGIPYPHQATNPASFSRSGGTGGTAKNDIRSQTETMEEFIAGMTDHEYVMLTIANPVHHRVLEKWLTVVSKEQTQWQSIMQGTSSVNFSIALPMMYGGNLGNSLGYNHGVSSGQAVGHGHVSSWTDGTTAGSTHGISHTDSTGTNTGFAHGTGTSHATSQTSGTSETQTTTQGHTHTTSITHSNNISHGVTKGSSGGTSWNNGTNTGTSYNNGSSSGLTNTNTNSQNHSGTYGKSVQYGFSAGASENLTVKVPFVAQGGLSVNQGANWSHTSNSSFTNGTGSSQAHATSNTTNQSYGGSSGSSSSYGGNTGWTDSVSDTTTNGTSKGFSDATSSSTSLARGVTQSTGTSDGTSANQTWSNGNSQSSSNGSTDSTSSSQSQSVGGSNSSSNTVSTGQSSGNANAWSLGTSSSMAIAPGMSIGKSYAWTDAEVQNIVKLVDYQRERLMKALSGQGAFFVDTMIATEDETAHDSAVGISKASFYDKQALVSPLQVLEPKGNKKEHLLYHFSVFSPCLELNGIPGHIDSYRYSTVLLADELTAYTHPPRMSDGGLYADVEDMPQLSVPSDRQNGEIYMGHVLSGQRWSEKMFEKYGTGYATDFKYSVFESELMHAVFQGESRSGKTVSAMRFIRELSKVIRKKTKKRLRIIVFDQKKDWRKLARVIEPDRFRFYKIDSIGELGLRLNLCRIAPNVNPETHIKTLAETFVSAYGLGILGSQIMKDALFQVYHEADCLGEDWSKKAHINSQKVTLGSVYRKVQEILKNLGASGNNVKDSYQRVLMRLKDYSTSGTIVHEVFATENGISMHELLGDDDIVVLEAQGLDRVERNFVYGLMFASIYSYGINNGTFLSEDQYETILVVEEANAVLIGQGSGDSGGNGGDLLPGQSRFEDIVDQAAGNGMFVVSITQKIHLMPSSIVNSSGLWFVGRSRSPDAHNIILPSFGKNVKYDYQFGKWLANQPDLWFMVRTGRTSDFKQSAPVHVLIDLIPYGDVSDEMLMEMRKEEAIKRRVNELGMNFKYLG